MQVMSPTPQGACLPGQQAQTRQLLLYFTQGSYRAFRSFPELQSAMVDCCILFHLNFAPAGLNGLAMWRVIAAFAINE